MDGLFAKRDSIKAAFDDALNVTDVMAPLGKAQVVEAKQEQPQERPTARNAGEWAMLNIGAPVANTLGIQPYNAIGNLVNPLTRVAFDTTLMPKATKLQVGKADDFSTEWFAQNISAGLSIALLYGGLAKGTQGLAKGGGWLAASRGYEGLAASAKVLGRPQNALLLGGTLYEGLRDPEKGETRFGNMLGAAGGLYVFGKGAQWSQNMSGTRLWATRFGTGAVGTSFQNLLSSAASRGEVPSFSDLKRDVVAGGVMNLILPPLMGMGRLRKAAAETGTGEPVGERKGLMARIVDEKTAVVTTEKGNASGGRGEAVAVAAGEQVTVVKVIEKPGGVRVTVLSNKDTIIEKPGEPRMIRKADGRTIMEDADGTVLSEHRPKHTIPVEERPLNVASGAHEAIGKKMSNFEGRRFTLDGRTYESVEAFYQGLKWPEAAKRAEISSLKGSEAKSAGRGSPRAETFMYEGQEIRFGSVEHHALVKKAIKASLEQNPQIMNEFLDTHPRPLEHKTGRPERPGTALPGSKFADILMEVRQELHTQYRGGSEVVPGVARTAESLPVTDATTKPVSQVISRIRDKVARENHNLPLYEQAFADFGPKATGYIGAGSDSVAIGLEGGRVLKITGRTLTPEMGNRPVDLPILEQGTRDVGGRKVNYFIQPEGTPAPPDMVRAFIAWLHRLGYYMGDPGERQIVMHAGEPRLADPFAIVKKD